MIVVIASYKYLEEKRSESGHESCVLLCKSKSANQKVMQKLIKKKYYLFILIYKLKNVYIF